MKKLEIRDLNKVSTESAFDKKVEIVKAEAQEMVKKTFSMEQGDLDRIQELAIRLSQKRRKVATASEVLRMMIRHYPDDAI
jgi:Mg2+ and Co2+ transporter CorA